MHTFKNFFILAILTIWRIDLANAQMKNPCPQMENYEVSFSDAKLNIYESPNINSQKIAEISAETKFRLSDLSAQYYDGICWYQIYTFSMNDQGWIGFKLSDQYQDNNQNSNFTQTESAAESSTKINIKTNQEIPDSNNFMGWAQLFFNDVARDLNVSQKNLMLWILIAGIIILFLPIMIAKTAEQTMLVFSPKNRKKDEQQVGKDFVKKGENVIKPLEIIFEDSANLLDFENNQSSNESEIGCGQDKTFDKVLNQENGDENNFDNIPNNNLFGANKNDNQDNQSIILSLESSHEDLEKIPTISVESIILNYNSSNKHFFDTKPYFLNLRPTDNVIHGLAGNLGMDNGSELEIVETSQASYLGFEAEGQLWLIPNLKLSRWQRLLKNSAFFNVLGDSSKPKLVKPAQLELVSGDRHRLIAKGIFN